eukprot:m.385870 g.385870  ORF g.385870 m.385870 type:complete len:50 (+) comp16743_c0_seq22:1359-1508(+)
MVLKGLLCWKCMIDAVTHPLVHARSIVTVNTLIFILSSSSSPISSNIKM